MKPFSLKNTALVASLLTVSVGVSAFAEPVKADCTKDPLFVSHACNVCYTEVRQPVKTATGWTSELSDVVIPWEHSNIELQEVITESAQKLPEMIASTDVKITPSAPDQIWEFDTDIVWYEVGNDREFFIEKGDNVGLYTLKTGVKLSLSGKGAKDTVLIKTPLMYEEYDKDLNQSANGKSRNICVLNTFSTGTSTTTTPPPVKETTPPPAAVTPPKAVTPPLNAAGPEEEDTEEPVAEITAEQTETQAGPGMWIFLLFAFIFSSAYTAWKKQKI